MTAPPDIKEMLLQIAEGDEKAFRALFDRYRERLFTFSFGLTHSRVDAEEVVQDVFLKIWESRQALLTVDQPEHYIFRMTRNRTLDLLARTARNEKLIRQVWANLSAPGSGSEQLLEAKDSQVLINQAVEGLSERKKTIFVLSRTEGLTLDEIAERLGISKQTVKNTLTEALRQIKDHLSRHSELLAILFWISCYPSLL